MKVAVVHFGENRFLELKRDIILGIYYTLRASGYDTVMSNNMLDPGRLNIIIGLDITSPDIRAQLRNSQLAYVVYETEIIHEGRVNSRPKAAIDLVNDYLPTLAKARAVLSPFRYVSNGLREYGVEAVYTPWGYIPEFDGEVEERDKGIDCYFFGIITAKRRQILSALANAGLKVKTSDYPGVPTFMRNHFMSRAKLVLSLQHDREWMTVNPYRIMYAVQNNCCVVVEKQQHDEDGYGGYGCLAETGKFVDYCVDLIRSRDYHGLQTAGRDKLLANPMLRSFEHVKLT